jgi:hypothetical protein
LGVCEARYSGLIDPANFAINVGGLRLHTGERRDDARIFVGLVESGPGQQ